MSGPPKSCALAAMTALRSVHEDLRGTTRTYVALESRDENGERAVLVIARGATAEDLARFVTEHDGKPQKLPRPFADWLKRMPKAVA